MDHTINHDFYLCKEAWILCLPQLIGGKYKRDLTINQDGVEFFTPATNFREFSDICHSEIRSKHYIPVAGHLEVGHLYANDMLNQASWKVTPAQFHFHWIGHGGVYYKHCNIPNCTRCKIY